MSMTDLFTEKSDRVYILDGATGTNLQSMGLDRGRSGEFWVLEQPDKIIELHTKFITAGADVILTCTFNANRFRMEHLGLTVSVAEINTKAAALARQAATSAATGKTPLVAGSIGPCGTMLAPYGPLEADEAEAGIAEQARALNDAGVDFLVIETQYDLNEALAAYRGVRSVSNLPLVVSFSYDRGLRTMMGVKPQQVVEAFGNLDVQALGINCGHSLEENEQVLAALRQAAPAMPIWFKPNAGLPSLDAEGQTHYDVTPAQMAEHARSWPAGGARFIGGCCGTSPEHLAAIAQTVKIS